MDRDEMKRCSAGYTVEFVPVYVTPRTYEAYASPYPKRLLHYDRAAATRCKVAKVPCNEKFLVAIPRPPRRRVYLGMEASCDGELMGRDMGAGSNRGVYNKWPIWLGTKDEGRINVEYEDWG